MKKTMSLIAAVAASLLFAQSAVAGCLTQPNETVLPSYQVTTYFTPGKVGYHQIKYKDFYLFGGNTTLNFAWSNNGGASWNVFTEKEVTPTWQTETLYAGSSDIRFRFIYRNWSTSVQLFYSQHCTN